MPYITQERRDVLDASIDTLIRQLNVFGSQEGDINYTITRIVTEMCGSISYRNINTMMGVLSCVQQEFYRRIAIPYENQKIVENGDVFAATVTEEPNV